MEDFNLLSSDPRVMSSPPPSSAAPHQEEIARSWTKEQRDYTIANRRGGGLQLIAVASAYEENDVRVKNSISRLLLVKDSSWHDLSLLILGMSTDLLESIILADLPLRVRNGTVKLPKMARDDPALYNQHFDSKDGKPPSAEEMELL